uniref:Uncharacterized protein n=1 Tax=Bradyrhizobium diazoefficiens TaxID=1355477 RepID=A0A809YX04_9BRAD|nr:hypothetical protein XF3B_78310 [Bradyrhizobium diazoefficiens]BCE95139.1 hypothetical protein XF10B_79370 [Bradyrhizobium diazoefficiens]BCF64793.1 hypothetical protein XF18B_77410 [Bradyrhizobium diazoefficiens]
MDSGFVPSGAPRNDRELQLPLPVHLALLLPLPFLFLGVVPAVEAAGGGAEDAVMAGIVAGDAADDGALDAALGVGGGGRTADEKRGGDGEKLGFHGSMSPDAVSASQRARAYRGSRACAAPALRKAISCRRTGAQPIIAAMNLALRLRVISTATLLWFRGLPVRETAR